MKLKLFTISAAALLFAGLSSGLAYADTVTFTILNPSQITNSGKLLTYSATIAAPSTNAGNEYLNGDAFTFSAPFTIDDSPFFTNFPLFLTPGQSFTAVLFDINVPLVAPTATLPGTFTLLGGSTASTYNTLGTASFAATVTPEPSSLLLLGTGLLGTVGMCRRKVGTLVHRS